jgi:hypothetical protein
MQDVALFAAILREISFGILLVGLFYTFGMFLLGRLFAAMGEHGADHDAEHDVEKDYDHDTGHDYEKDYDMEKDYDVEKEYDMEKEYDFEKDYDLEKDYDVEKEYDVEKDYDVEKEYDAEKDYDVEKDYDHDVEADHELASDKHSGFFESERGAPLGVTIGTSLVSFGFLGSILYYEGLPIPFLAKLASHLVGVILVVYSVRTVLGKVFVESGFLIEPRHLVGRQVEAVSTINDDFGEVRTETEMGLRRFQARPFQKGVTFEKGTDLYIVSADDKKVFVDPRKDVIKWLQKQSGKKRKPAES